MPVSAADCGGRASPYEAKIVARVDVIIVVIGSLFGLERSFVWNRSDPPKCALVFTGCGRQEVRQRSAKPTVASSGNWNQRLGETSIG
jgi:hypothetical protein